MDSIDNVIRHWEGCPSIAVDSTTGGETEEVVPTLSITSRAESKGTGGSRCHGVIVFLMCLHIRAKLQLAVLVVVKLQPNDYGTRAQ